jgi:hypothetical protein
MLLGLNMFWAAPLCSSAQDFLDNLARRFAQLRVPNLSASDQTTIKSLSHSLAYEVPFNCPGLNYIKNRPKRRVNLKPCAVCTSLSGRSA